MKKAYVSLQVARLGTVVEMTQGNVGSGSDASGGVCSTGRRGNCPVGGSGRPGGRG